MVSVCSSDVWEVVIPPPVKSYWLQCSLQCSMLLGCEAYPLQCIANSPLRLAIYRALARTIQLFFLAIVLFRCSQGIFIPAYLGIKGISMPTPYPFDFLQEQMATLLAFCQYRTYLIGPNRNTLSHPPFAASLPLLQGPCPCKPLEGRSGPCQVGPTPDHPIGRLVAPCSAL